MKKVTFVLLILSFSAVAERGDLTGSISDQQNKSIKNVLIRIDDLNLQTKTDESGQFTIPDIEFGDLEVDVEVNNSKHFNTEIRHDGTPININIDALNLDDLVVSAIPLEHNLLKMTSPVAIISEEELIINRGLSLDQTVNQVTGVNSGSFGVGAGQIVIRGQQGPRVTILNNGQTVQDASRVSPDHWITTETLLAKQVEVLKGPATLLYGGGAVGGVVNIVDDVIPSYKIEGITGGFEGRVSDDAVGEQAAVLSMNAGLSENVMAHFSYFKSETDDYEIPGNAESEILHESEGHGNEEEEEKGSFGILENSSIDSDGFNLGVSWVGDQGYWGASYSDYSRNYGLPGHSHEHEHEDEHEGDEEHGDEEEEEIVRLDLNKSVFTLKGAHSFLNSEYIKRIRTHYTNTDYQHVEFEGDETGTVFDNQADELRFELEHPELGGFNGIFGVQLSNRDFSAIGEEAFIIPTDTQIWSVFLIEERDFNRWHGEFGLRFDDQSVSSALYDDFNDSAFSISLGATFELNEQWTLPINLTSAQRLPAAEEYFSNQGDAEELITHLATSLIEVGNLDLEHETANNFDVGLRYRNEGFSFNLALFYNQIDDYIFLRNIGEFVDEVPVAVYTQQNATFRGYEVDMGYELADSFNNQWGFRLFTDSTDAELNTGANVPRIPSDRFGLGVNWNRGSWSAGINHTHVAKQNSTANLELPTNGYDLLNININWVHFGSRVETLVFLKGNNLLDEEIRDHASFIKDVAPRPGRSISAGFRLMF